MKQSRFLTCFASLLLAGGLPSVHADPGPMQLWYDSPVAPIANETTSHDALPVGNGKIAGMVYGGVETEVLQFKLMERMRSRRTSPVVRHSTDWGRFHRTPPRREHQFRSRDGLRIVFSREEA